jgi:hypothetical protein
VVLGRITDVQTIAARGAIRELRQPRKRHGVRLDDGTICFAEVHWYEAHGIGKKRLKLKRILQEE